MKIKKVLFVLLVLSPLAMFFTRYSWWTLMLSYLVWPSTFCLIILFLRSVLRKKTIAALCCIASLAIITAYQYQKPHLPTQEVKIKEKYLSVYHCNVDKPGRHFDELLESVLSADADVVILQEIDASWKDAIEAKLRRKYSHFFIQAQKNCYGMAVFSKYGILNVQGDLLGSPYIRSFRCEILWENKKIVLWATRLFSPLIPSRWNIRNTQIKVLALRVSSEKQPVIVAGDLNLDIKDPHFKDLLKFSGLFIIQDYMDHKGSWPSLFPGFFRIWIDHVLAGNGALVQRSEILKSAGSDHLPVLAQVVIE